MTLEQIREVLGWCSVINFGLILWWALWIMLARDWIHRMHRSWFNVSAEQFGVIHYGGLGLFKLAVILFNVVPYIALRIVG